MYDVDNEIIDQYEFCAEPDPVLSETESLGIQVGSDWSGFPPKFYFFYFFASEYVQNTYLQSNSAYCHTDPSGFGLNSQQLESKET